jgi:CRISPR-associated protein Csd2
MATRGLYVFEHSSELGNAPAHELFDRIAIKPLGLEGESKPPRSFADYKEYLTVQSDHLPEGVTLNRMIG